MMTDTRVCLYKKKSQQLLWMQECVCVYVCAFRRCVCGVIALRLSVDTGGSRWTIKPKQKATIRLIQRLHIQRSNLLHTHTHIRVAYAGTHTQSVCASQTHRSFVPHSSMQSWDSNTTVWQQAEFVRLITTSISYDHMLLIICTASLVLAFSLVLHLIVPSRNTSVILFFPVANLCPWMCLLKSHCVGPSGTA